MQRFLPNFQRCKLPINKFSTQEGRYMLNDAISYCKKVFNSIGAFKQALSLSRTQCDQMSIFLIQNLAVYINENLPKSQNKLLLQIQNLAKYKKHSNYSPKAFKFFAKVLKIHQIWSHYRSLSSPPFKHFCFVFLSSSSSFVRKVFLSIGLSSQRI